MHNFLCPWWAIRATSAALVAIWSITSWAGTVPVETLNETERVTTAIQLPVEKFKLKNGLTVLILEDHSTPSFTYQTWFRVGSRHEKPGLTGLAHFFEHMMFKGTKKYPNGVIDSTIQSNGGVLNAFTTRDLTAYYFNLPSSKLKLAIDIEADRMRNLIFDPKEIQSEREVVKEERRYRYDDNVNGTIHEHIFSTVFKVHPYSWPVIGSMVDLNRASVADMMEFYRIHYAPNNAVVVVVGDVNTKDAKTWIEQAYGEIPEQTLAAEPMVMEPEQKSERRLSLKKPVQNTTMAVAYPTVAGGHDDMYALDLLASVLGEGDASRIHRRLVVQDQLANVVEVGSLTLGAGGLFELEVALKPKASEDRVLRSLEAEITKIQSTKVSDRELKRVKNHVMKGFVTRLRTNSGKASALAFSEIYFNDYKAFYRDLGRYLAVTAEDIQAVAKRYLQNSKRSIVDVRPGPVSAQGGI